MSFFLTSAVTKPVVVPISSMPGVASMIHLILSVECMPLYLWKIHPSGVSNPWISPCPYEPSHTFPLLS